MQQKCLVLDALGELGALCPNRILEGAMAEADMEIRKKVAEVISRVRPGNVVAFIEPLFQAEEGKVRAAAAAALGDIGGEEVYVCLREQAAKDEDRQVKSTCQVFITRWEADIMENVELEEANLLLQDRTGNQSA